VYSYFVNYMELE